MIARIIHGDCGIVLEKLASNSIDSIVTDPPYGLSFMGKTWDHDVPSVDIWRECLRVLKPGGHMVAFSGTRTYHRLAVAIEDAGFEIRDQLAWVYGSGFPKSHDVSKAIDKAAGAEREVIGQRRYGSDDAERSPMVRQAPRGTIDVTAPATAEAEQWQGWGTALKPAWEPICLARKPLTGTVAENVLAHGTGAINVDGCRIEGIKPQVTQGINSNASSFNVAKERRVSGAPTEGRFPANLIHDGSEEVLACFPDSKGQQGDVSGNEPSSITNGIYGDFSGRQPAPKRNDSGSAARFFYCAKASKADRNDGVPQGNKHPTVKPTPLMRYLCRLVTRPSGIVLDPFAGSGSTGRGAVLEGFNFIGIEKDTDFCVIARSRIRAVLMPGQLS